MSKKELEKVEDGFKVLMVNMQQVIGKFQHLVQAVDYLGNDIAMLQNNIKVVGNLLNQIKSKGGEKAERRRDSSAAKKADS